MEKAAGHLLPLQQYFYCKDFTNQEVTKAMTLTNIIKTLSGETAK
jgi:hypothetical protein